jgi:hypothetical protein
MRIIEIVAHENGGHNNQAGDIAFVPDGWAVIPEEMVCENFPFGEIEVVEIDGVMTVTKWTPGIVPAWRAPRPSKMDIIEAQVAYTAMMTDTLLEV